VSISIYFICIFWLPGVKMNTSPPIPTLEEVQRITNIEEPVIRNLHITQCYHELSAVLVWRTGTAANWCTFATWASKQAGQTIRKEDLARLLENRLRNSTSVLQAARSVTAAAHLQGLEKFEIPQPLALSARSLTAALDRFERGNQQGQ
jgi:hypothetical protein